MDFPTLISFLFNKVLLVKVLLVINTGIVVSVLGNGNRQSKPLSDLPLLVNLQKHS